MPHLDIVNSVSVSMVIKMAVPTKARIVERSELVNRAGAKRLRNATHAVRV